MAKFKTAILQREIVLNVAVAATVNADPATGIATRKTTPAETTVVLVGDLVKLTAAAAATGAPAYITRVLSLAAATHIVAQSDETMDYGHIPVENRDYRYLPIVNGTEASTVTSASAVKRVALFPLIDKSDIEIDTANSETA